MLYISVAIFCIILVAYIFRNNIIMNIYKLPLIRKSWQLPNMAASTFEVPQNNTKPVVVCCGDSITHGHIGYDWVSALRKKDDSKIYPTFRFSFFGQSDQERKNSCPVCLFSG